MDNDTIFDVLAFMIIIGICFICYAVPVLLEEPEPEQLKSFSLEVSFPEIEAPDVSRAFEVKANKEAAKSRLDDLAGILAKLDEIEPSAVRITYAGCFYVTSYSNTPEQCGNSLGITASGKLVTEDPTCRTVAVDPAIIPLGTKLIIEGYEGIIWEAADTGSAINNYDLDLFTFSEAESISFNPVYLDAWIVEEL